MRRIPQESRRKFLFAVARTMSAGSVAAAVVPAWNVFGSSLLDSIVRRRTWSMGTMVNLSLTHDVEGRLGDAFECLYRVDRNLSAHQAASDLSRMNLAEDWYEAGDDLLAVTKAALMFGDLTAGAFDVTVLPAMRRLGFVPDLETAQRGELSERIDFTQLRVRASAVRIEPGYGVDFGGIAKGYAVDEAIASLRNGGVQAALLEAGGDLYAHGRPSEGRRWNIGVRDPRRMDRLVANLEIEDEAVATSGIYLQNRETNGRKVGHLVNPFSGAPVDEILSCTVVARSAMNADVLATAASVLPRAASLDLIQRTSDVEAIWLFSDGSVEVSPGLRRRTEWI